MSMTFRVHGTLDGPELNVANGNFHHLMISLGFEPNEIDWCGDLEVRDLFARVTQLRRGLESQAAEFERSEIVDHHAGRATYINLGCGADQMRRYVEKLTQIMLEAELLGLDVEYA